MKNKLYTVTLAISAYNEESNIRSFLKSVLAQKEKGFILKDIKIYSDGSTDNTVSIAKSFKSEKIKVLNFNKREGKSYRLNQIFRDLKNDFLVLSDADAIFSHPYVISNIVLPLIKNNKVGMCSGNSRPVKATTFLEQAVNYTHEAYAPLRKLVRGGNNIFSIDGKILACSKKFVKQLLIPNSTIANDAFIYLNCITLGYKYQYIPTAVVNFRSPQTMNDQIKQNTRFVSARSRMLKYFDNNLVNKEFYIPRDLLIKLQIEQLLKHPIHCFAIFIVNLYCRVRSLLNGQQLTAKWKIAESTKKL